MPNRIIKESICTSENIDRLTEFQEVFFYRLMVNCDDFGRFDARPKLLSSRLFPLRDVSTETVMETLDALREADLIVVYEVGGHPYLQMKTWEKHQQARASKSKYPSFGESVVQTADINCNQMISDDINGNQETESEIKNHRIRNRIRNTLSDNRIRNRSADDDDNQMIGDGTANEIQRDHDRVLNAAEDAGFKMSNNVRAAMIALYAEHGLEKVLEGLQSCTDHGATTLAYLKAVLKGEPRAEPKKEKDFEQRDYSGEQDAAMERMIAWHREHGGYGHEPGAAGA